MRSEEEEEEEEEEGGGEEFAWLRDSPPRKPDKPSVEKTKRQGRLFRLDDLLADSAKEKNLKLEREAKRSKVLDNSSSDDESADTAQKAQLTTIVQACEKQVLPDNGSQEVPKWGELVFGRQRKSPQMVIGDTDSSHIKAALSAARTLSLRSEGDLFPDDGELMALELLKGNWLLPFVKSYGQVDPALYKWAFHKMAYSRDKNIERAALKFLSNSLILQAQGSESPEDIAWFPCLESILEVLYNYGYIDTYGALSSTMNFSISNEESADLLDKDGPPRNLHSLLHYITSCSETRKWRKAMSVLDLESLLFAISRLWLDRRIFFLSSSIQECVEALISQFAEDEWAISSDRLATLISRVSKHKVNILRILTCLCGQHSRLKSLRKATATKLLLETSNIKESPSSIVDVVTSFSNVDPKIDKLDFFDLYYCIVLVDICLCSDLSLSEQKCLMDPWLSFLKCCSIRISSGNFAPYANKVRNRASYLWHNYISCFQEHTKDQKVLESENFLLDE